MPKLENNQFNSSSKRVKTLEEKPKFKTWSLSKFIILMVVLLSLGILSIAGMNQYNSIQKNYLALKPNYDQNEQAMTFTENESKQFLVMVTDYDEFGRLGNHGLQLLYLLSLNNEAGQLNIANIQLDLKLMDKNQEIKDYDRQANYLAMRQDLAAYLEVEKLPFILINNAESKPLLDQLEPIIADFSDPVTSPKTSYQANQAYKLSTRDYQMLFTNLNQDHHSDQERKNVLLSKVLEQMTDWRNLPHLSGNLKAAKDFVHSELPFPLLRDLYFDYNLKQLRISYHLITSLDELAKIKR
ncbi:hypothetical protein [Eremococcus coleocola]|uniref:Uncharacterized protein n=1 Tax=Eremococcus coleocola ACS-139-V-Col8 TaxID=908337 RepID=E4KPG2_9LACT|nr:hypothetical protein [Eremococcus coleocola]EFR31070.1 hypothetical protein HMPREF9257_1450 [Eremococcus coleocola ACS-139-V-Col8]